MNTEVILQNAVSVSSLAVLGASLRDSYISPVYVTSTNMIVPLTSISLTSLHSNAVEFMTILGNFFTAMQSLASIWISTLYFIMKESIVEISNIMSDVDKILLLFIIYNTIMFSFKNYKLNDEVRNLRQNQDILLSEIELLGKNLSCLRKSERMREEWEQMWAEEIREYYAEHNNKYKELNKELKKLRKEMNQYA